jgi:hypothetical protein
VLIGIPIPSLTISYALVLGDEYKSWTFFLSILQFRRHKFRHFSQHLVLFTSIFVKSPILRPRPNFAPYRNTGKAPHELITDFTPLDIRRRDKDSELNGGSYFSNLTSPNFSVSIKWVDSRVAIRCTALTLSRVRRAVTSCCNETVASHAPTCRPLQSKNHTPLQALLHISVNS